MELFKVFVIFDPLFSLVWKSSIDLFDAVRLTTQLLSKKQVAGLIKTILPRTDALDPKAKEPAINALL